MPGASLQNEAIRYVLALDSAMTGCAAAIYDVQTGQCSHKSMSEPRGQAEFLVPMAQECAEQAGIALSDVHLISVTHGPGSFTGLRVSLSTAKSFALALDIPCVGVSSLDILKSTFLHEVSLSAGKTLAVLIETKRSDFYVQYFDHDGHSLTRPAAAEAIDICAALAGKDVVFCGDAISRYCDVVGADISGYQVMHIMQPDPKMLAMRGLQMFLVDAGAPKIVEPLYLRGADVSKSKKKQRVLQQSS